MFCKNCGSMIDDNATACPLCGAPVVKPEQPKEQPFAEYQQPVQQTGYSDPYQQQPYQQPPYQQPPYQQPPYPQQQQPPYQQPPQQQATQSNGLAVAGLVLAFFMPLIGLILSIVGLVNSKKLNGAGKGCAIAGIIISAIWMAIIIIIVVVEVVVLVPKTPWYMY